MKPSSLTEILCSLLLSFIVAFCIFLRATGCPDPEDIKPCTCSDGGDGKDILQCKNIMNGHELREVFRNSVGHHYGEVEILHSTFTYIPHEIFADGSIEYLTLLNVTMVKLLDEPPQPFPSLHFLEIQNCRFLSLLTFDGFQSFPRLQKLGLHDTRERIIGDSFNQYITKDLESLVLFGTDTVRIKPGALSKFSRLQEIFFKYNKLTELRRDMFPVPFYGYYLDFSENKITSLAQDLFTQMPMLQSLFLTDNLIATLPEFTLDGSIGTRLMVRLQGNPIKCDCRFKWYLQRKDKFSMNGNCSSPKKISGKSLDDLLPSDLRC